MAKANVNIQPLGKRIVVKPHEEEEGQTQGGLIIPPSAQDDKQPEIGEVVKIGTGEADFEFAVKEGDKVFFKNGYTVSEIEIEDTTYYILSEEDVLAIIK